MKSHERLGGSKASPQAKSTPEHHEVAPPGQTATESAQVGSTHLGTNGSEPRASGSQDAARVHPLRDFLSHHRAALACFFGFILLWAVELYMVQARTLISSSEIGPRLAFWAPKIRLVMDLLFAAGLTFLLRRWLVAVLAVGGFFCDLGLITYYQYFHRPVSLLTLINSLHEGQVLGKFAWDLIPKGVAVVLALLVIAKLALLFVTGWPRFPRRFAWPAAAAMAVAYCAIFLVLNRADVDPLYKIRTTRGVGRLGMSRGYLAPWGAELYYLQGDEILQEALARRSRPSDNLTPLEGSIPIRRRLIIIQAESLDYNVLDHVASGQEVTPFLNRLRSQSMFYRVRPFHTYGSSDADFVVLAGVRPSPHVVTYKIPAYPWVNTLPEFLKRFGFATYGFHGNEGRFYERRGPWEKMGFAGIFFEEELVENVGLPTDNWGVRDRDVLRFSQQMLKETPGKVCHFIITLTTHTPYTELLASERQIFANPRSLDENYFNNMRYLDSCLQEYIAPLRDATVMIYADHPTEVHAGDFQPSLEDGKEFVPCFIYDTETNLAQRQQSRSDPKSTDGWLTMLDVATFLRRQIEASASPGPAGSTKAAP